MLSNSRSRQSRYPVYRESTWLGFPVAALLAVLLILPGCGSGGDPAPGASTLNAYADINTSPSSRPELSTSVKFLGKLASLLDPDTTSLTVWRSDAETEEIFDGPLPSSSDRLNSLIADRVRFIPKDAESRSLTFWQTVTDRIAHKAGPSFLLEVGDGFAEGDGPAVHRQIKKLAHQLATSPLRFLGFVGTAPGSREQIRADFGELGDRLRFFEFGDAEQVASLAESAGGVQ